MRPSLPPLAAPVLVVAALLAGRPAFAGDRAAILLTDGQTIEGEAEVLPGGDVEIVIDRGGAKQRLRLAASAVERIERLDGRAEETLSEAVVRLADGRELRGEARVRSSEVVVKGAYGEVVVPRADVLSITPVLPELPRTVADADIGQVLPLPEGWVADTPSGVGERLRLAREDGLATVSVLLRPLPSGQDVEARVRAALRHDLGAGASLERVDGRRWRVRDDTTDPTVQGGWPLHLVGVAEVVDDHVVFFRALQDAAEKLDPALVRLVDDLVARQTLLRAGPSRDGAFFRDPALGLFVEAPPGFRVREGKEPGERACVVSPLASDARLVVHVVDDPAPREALLDLLEGPPESSDEVPLAAGARAYRARREGERGVALRAGEGSVAVLVRAAKAEQLAALSLGVVLIDPTARVEALDAAERLLPLLSRAREALEGEDPTAALAALEPVLAELEDEPTARALRVAALRPRLGPDALIEELDLAWVASGAPWVAQELARTLARRAEELAKAEQLDRAVAAIERAAEVWGDEAVVAVAVDLFVRTARQAFDAGEPHAAWSRLARLRQLVGALPAIDEAEAALRLRAARAALKAGETIVARREARRAYALGAEAADVERIYQEAEKLDVAAERARAAARERDPRATPAGAGGLEFGVPPTTSNRGKRIKDTPFSRPTRGSTRFVRPVERGRGDFVRGRPDERGKRVRGQSTKKGRRVRTNGTLIFE